jgi:hypothetical protein
MAIFYLLLIGQGDVKFESRIVLTPLRTYS